MSNVPTLLSLTAFMEQVKTTKNAPPEHEVTQVTVDGVPERVVVQQWLLTPVTRVACEQHARQLAFLYGKAWVPRMFGFLLLGPEDATTDATWSTADTAMLFMDATTRFPCVQDIMFENDAPTWEQRVTPAQRLSLAIQACEIARAAPGFRLGFFNLKTLRLDVQTHRLYLHDFRGASEQFAVANMTAFNEGYVRMVTPQGDAPRGDPRSFEEHFDTESQFSLGVVIWQLLLGAPAFVRPHPAWNDPRTTIHLSEFVSGALKTGCLEPAGFEVPVLHRVMGVVRKLNAANPINRPNVVEVLRGLRRVQEDLSAEASTTVSATRLESMRKVQSAFAAPGPMSTRAGKLLQRVHSTPEDAFRVASDMLHVVADANCIAEFTNVTRNVLRAAVDGTTTVPAGSEAVKALVACTWTLLKRAGLTAAQHHMLHSLGRDLFRQFPTVPMARVLVGMTQESPEVPADLLLDLVEGAAGEDAIIVPALHRLLGAVSSDVNTGPVADRAAVLMRLVATVAGERPARDGSGLLATSRATLQTALQTLRKLLRLAPGTYSKVASAAVVENLVGNLAAVLAAYGSKAAVFDQCVATLRDLVVPPPGAEVVPFTGIHAQMAALVAAVAPGVCTAAAGVPNPVLAVALVAGLATAAPGAVLSDTQRPFLALLLRLHTDLCAAGDDGSCGDGAEVCKMLRSGIDALHWVGACNPAGLDPALCAGLAQLWDFPDMTVATRNQLLDLVVALCSSEDAAANCRLFATYWVRTLALAEAWEPSLGEQHLNTLLKTLVALGCMHGVLPEPVRTELLLRRLLTTPEVSQDQVLMATLRLAEVPTMATWFVDKGMHTLVARVVPELVTTLCECEADVMRTMGVIILRRCVKHYVGLLTQRDTVEAALQRMLPLVLPFPRLIKMWLRAVTNMVTKTGTVPSPSFMNCVGDAVQAAEPEAVVSIQHLRERLGALLEW